MRRKAAFFAFSLLLALAIIVGPLHCGDSLFGADGNDVKVVESKAVESKPPEEPSWKKKGYPNGEPVIRGGRKVVLRHFVRDLEKFPDNARIVYLAVPLNKKETLQQRLRRDRQIKLWMRTLAVNPRMFLEKGKSFTSGSVSTIELKNEIDEQRGEIVYKGIFWVE